MADVYTPPDDFAYLPGKPFMMPSSGDDRWAMAFTSNNATIMAATLSVMVTISFLLLWNIICFFGMCFAGEETLSRYIALVILWNSNDPWFAFKALLHYSFGGATTANSKGNDKRDGPKDGSSPDAKGDTASKPTADAEAQTTTDPKASNPTRDDIWYGLIFCFLAFAAFGGGIAMGIIAPSLIQIGNVAPVRPGILFYPRTPATDAETLQDFGLRAPGVMRSLGSVEAAKVSQRASVLVERDQSYDSRGEDAVLGIKYSYSLSGVDMGLRRGHKLALAVEGYCFTEYGWENEDVTEEDLELADWYNLWDNPSEETATWVLINNNDIAHAPAASFTLHPEAAEQLLRDSNVSYAVLVHSAHRASITQGDDPWYATELRDAGAPPTPFDAGHWVRRRRPVLSCWERNVWSYSGREVASVFDLKNAPGMDIPGVLLEVLETALGAGPMIVRLGSASGDSALRSRTTSPNGVIDASKSSVFGDMERLVVASFVATRAIFADATMFDPPEQYDNIMMGADGQPKPGAGDFVVSSTDIQTLSLTGIVSLAAVFGFLVLVNLCISSCIFYKRGTSESKRIKWTRFHVLGAAQLFRHLYCDDKTPKLYLQPTAPGR